MDTHWTHIGHSLDTHWTLTGHTLDTHWILTGHSLDTHWTLRRDGGNYKQWCLRAGGWKGWSSWEERGGGQVERWEARKVFKGLIRRGDGDGDGGRWTGVLPSDFSDCLSRAAPRHARRTRYYANHSVVKSRAHSVRDLADPAPHQPHYTPLEDTPRPTPLDMRVTGRCEQRNQVARKPHVKPAPHQESPRSE